MNNSWLWLVSVVIVGGYVGNTIEACAQIIPDGTLPSHSVVTSSGNTVNITGGTQIGTNLFHSFREFSIPNGGEAFFNSDADIQNIISRVTGGSTSTIDGLIRTLGRANLFLINPNGIVFGQNASLNVGGSFVGTTANGIQFGNAGIFSASNPQAPSPLLTINPSALLFNQLAVAPIQIYSSTPSGLDPSKSFTATGLRVPDGQSLLLVGSDVSMNNGGLFAFGGHVELGGLTGIGIIGLQVNDKNLSLSFPNGVTRADVSLTNRSTINVRAQDGGSIAINAQNLNLAESSTIRAGIALGLGSVGSQAGDITLNALEAITIAGSGSLVSNNVNPNAVGNSGNINIQARSLSIINGGSISAGTFGRGNAGSVNISARDTVSLDAQDSGSSIFNNVLSDAVGNSGGINITTGSLFMTNGAQIQADMEGKGNSSGMVTIVARDTVSLDGVDKNYGFPSGIFTNVEEEAVGNSGGINITTGSLFVTNRAQLASNTKGTGNAGNILIEAQDQVSLLNSIIISEVTEKSGVGNGGNINIRTGSLLLKDASALLADTENQGNAGNIIIDARDFVVLEGQGPSAGDPPNNIVPNQISTTVEADAVGNGGNINISTGLLSIADRGFINSSIYGQGNAGNINITTELLSVTNDSTLSSSTFGWGDSGSIKVNANFFLLNNSRLSTRSNVENRQAGNIDITTAKGIQLDNGALITAETKGGQGNITVRSYDLIMRRNSNITTNAQGQNVIGGNINIDTDILAALENSDINANSTDFRGGRVAIKAQGIIGTQFRDALTSKSDITATGANPQLNGTVQINTPDVDPSQGLVPLPEIVVDPAALIAQNPCQKSNGSTFVALGRGGLPANPTQALTTQAVRVGLVQPTSTIISQSQQQRNQLNAYSLQNWHSQTITKKTSKTQDSIVEAQGWIVNNKGEIILTADNSTATQPQNLLQSPPSCPKG